MKLFQLLFFFLLLVLACKQPEVKEENQFATILQEYHSAGTFNGSALVVKDDIVLFSKSYGYVDSAKQDTLTSEHEFGIGSIYKEFPAVVLMRLVERGKVSLDDRINKHFKALPEWSSKITMRHLLQYTSGLPRIDFNKYFSKNLPINEKYLLNDLITLSELEFEPGSDYLYSNFNPYLIIKVIEHIEQKPFAKVVQSHLFHTLSISSGKFKSAYPYKSDEPIAKPMNSEFEEDQYSIEYSSLLLTMKPLDLAIWFRNLNELILISNESLLSIAQPASLEIDDMQAPLGNTEIKNGKVVTHLHHGSMGNYESLVKRNNEEDWTIVLMTNQKNKNVFEILEKIEKKLK